MQVIQTGNDFIIYTDMVQTHDTLPVGVYVVCFSKEKGFYLELHSNIEILEDKIYGVHLTKVAKVMRTYKTRLKSLGVILSGDKGMGKSLFAKLVCKEFIEQGYPVILVNEYIPGIAHFLDSIEQECAVLFDEFEKVFAKDNKDDPQVEILTLFDGLSMSKKCYLITCNEINKLNDYLLNRTGRCFYHFRFNYPVAEEIKEYLQDKLDKKYYNQIEEVITFSYRVPINFDHLEAIAFELNAGENFKEAVKDLNIVNITDQKYMIYLYLQNGQVFHCTKTLDMFSSRLITHDFDENYALKVTYNPKKGKPNHISHSIIMQAEDITVSYDEEYEDDYTEAVKLKIDHIEILPCLQTKIYYDI